MLKSAGVIGQRASKAYLIKPADLARAMTAMGCPAWVVRPVAALQHYKMLSALPPLPHPLQSESSSTTTSSEGEDVGEDMQPAAAPAAAVAAPAPQALPVAPLAVPATLPDPKTWASSPFLNQKYGLGKKRAPAAFNSQMESLHQVATNTLPTLLRAGVFEGAMVPVTWDKTQKDIRR